MARAVAPRPAGLMPIRSPDPIDRASVAEPGPDGRAFAVRAAVGDREIPSADPTSLDFDANQVLDDRYPLEP